MTNEQPSWVILALWFVVHSAGIKTKGKIDQLTYRAYLSSSPSSVPDPKLIISDPDPQIENQEFRIRIRIMDPDPSVN